MNRYELEQELEVLKKKRDVMQADLEKFGAELSATSQVAIIARIVIIDSDIADYEKMIELLKFEEIIGGEFK